MRSYFYALLRHYLSLFVLKHNTCVEIDPTSEFLVAEMEGGKVFFRTDDNAPPHKAAFDDEQILTETAVAAAKPDFFVASGLLHYERDIQAMLSYLRGLSDPSTRLILVYYSSLWKPLAYLATWLGVRKRAPEANWLASKDVENLLHLEEYELVRNDQKVLCPVYIPLISNLLNRYIAPLPLLRNLCLLNIAVARPLFEVDEQARPSVSVVVAARNEAGHIEEIIQRTPPMGTDDELIFIEGNSTDDTWEVIQKVQKDHADRNILIGQQGGKGKGDAVRKGFDMASKDILMILDADMTVPPEDLVKFYDAIRTNKGEFINGSRLVYPMDKNAMRFFNILGNKFFAQAFSYVLSQRLKDTLCGTKVLTRENYEQLAANRSFFGNFDPFGDFDLIFGAARMGLKIIEVPITYRERRYGETNISRWRHGAILLAMLAFAARRIKFR